MKGPDSTKLPNAASCSNISESVLGFGRLTHGVEAEAFDKENSLPAATERARINSRGRYDSVSASSQSIRKKRSDDELRYISYSLSMVKELRNCDQPVCSNVGRIDVVNIGSSVPSIRLMHRNVTSSAYTQCCWL